MLVHGGEKFCTVPTFLVRWQDQDLTDSWSLLVGVAVVVVAREESYTLVSEETGVGWPVGRYTEYLELTGIDSPNLIDLVDNKPNMTAQTERYTCSEVTALLYPEIPLTIRLEALSTREVSKIQKQLTF